MQASGAGVDASTVQALIDDAVAETVLSTQAERRELTAHCEAQLEKATL